MIYSTISCIYSLVVTTVMARFPIVRTSIHLSLIQFKTYTTTEIRTCGSNGGRVGSQKASEWVRTAFHDSVTHDAAAKTGGLDASIQFELDRPENLGGALNNTLSDITIALDIRTSAADLLALAFVLAAGRCGDMYVPLRLGRKDATEAGIMGVPEPQTDLNTTRRRFATASLSEGMTSKVTA